MKIDWSKSGTWVAAGVVIAIIGAVVGQVGDNGEAVNPVIVIGVIFALIGAFTWAIRRGLESSRRD